MRYEERALLLSCVLLAALMLAIPALANVTHALGVARDTSNGRVAYIEHHQYLASGPHLIKYYAADGNVIASKEITYPGLPQHPEINQHDVLRDEQITLSLSGQTLQVHKRTPRETEQFTLTVDEKTIIDAGFDAFIRSTWDQFMTGSEQRYKFAIAGQPRLLNVFIKKEPGSPHAFTVRARNVLVRLFVSEIQLRYDAQRRLQSYQGLTNLNVDARHVLIEFTHHSTTEPLARPLTEWLPDSLRNPPAGADPLS